MPNRTPTAPPAQPMSDARAAAEALFDTPEQGREKRRKTEIESVAELFGGDARATAEAMFEQPETWRELKRRREVDTVVKLDRLRAKRELLEAAESIAAGYGLTIQELLDAAAEVSEAE